MNDIPEYRDSCPTMGCESRGNLPKMLRTNDCGTGVEGFYVCPRGHSWYTSRGWWDGVPHTTDSDLHRDAA